MGKKVPAPAKHKKNEKTVSFGQSTTVDPEGKKADGEDFKPN